jgi:hypothetical protein
MQETAEQYRQRMFGYIGKNDAMKLQAAAPRKLARLLKGLTPSKLRKRPSPGKWSIAEIVNHMADTELVAGFRIRFILGNPGSPIQGFDQDVWVTALHYDRASVRQSFERFRILREANLALLKTINREQWKDQGIHSERGPESVDVIVRMFAGHDINHLSQIERILAADKR